MEKADRKKLLEIASGMVANDDDDTVVIFLTFDVLRAKGFVLGTEEYWREYEVVHAKIRDLKARKPGVVVKILRDELGGLQEMVERYKLRTPESREAMRKVSEEVLEALREAGLDL